MPDHKEHHFCLAYKGERLRITPFETLHFAQVEGTSTLDGTQLVKVSLQRGNGRRESAIQKIVQEYNMLSGTDPIVPCLFAAKQTDAVMCFKATQKELPPIVQRIQSDQTIGSSRYWSWSAREAESRRQEEEAERAGCKKKSKPNGFAGLEGLVRSELNLNPSALRMQSAYDQVARAYVQVHGKELKNSGTFPSKDKDFLVSELRRHFDKERMYIVSPPSKQAGLSPAAKALVQGGGGIMDDIQFASSTDEERRPAPYNATAVRYLRELLGRTQNKDAEVMTVAFREVLDGFNRDHEGLYRRTCIVPFMAPFLATGAVEVIRTTEGGEALRVHTRQALAQLGE